ncbi:hypothetical protein Btru_075036 [Bulinus truncatus]|nr:hypothetical protein Btru_075036 [Bulinus truncatus]
MKSRDYLNTTEQSTGSLTSSPAMTSRPSVVRDSVDSKQQQQQHVLPPCRVCGDDGAGFHYGVNTCEACKGFFHRSLKVFSMYRCSGNGSCDLKKIKRQRSCQYCRYQKCVQVGMSKEAIKTGRYTSHKKTSDIMEVKRLQENMDISETLILEKSPSSEPHSTESSKASSEKMESKAHISTFTESPRSVASWIDTHSPVSSEVYDYSVYSKLLSPPKSFSSHSDSTFTSPYSSDALMRSPETPLHNVPSTSIKPEVLDILSPVATPDNVFGSESGGEQKFRTHCDMIKYELPPETISEFPSETNSQIPPERNSQIPLERNSTIPPERNSPFPPEHVNIPCCSSYTPLEADHIYPPINHSRSPASPKSYKMTDSKEHRCSFSGAAGDPINRAHNSPTSHVQSLVKSIFADKREAIQQIREGHKQYFSVLFHLDKRCDELKQQQKLHAEQCEDKIKIFGQMYFISDKEYDEIWATTGLDVDNRKLLLKNWETNCELLAYALIKFSKNLPCFTLLDLTTQADLIKSARPEVNILNSMSLFDTELKVGIWAGGTQYCHKEFGQFVNHDFFWSYTATCRRVQGLNLTPEERAVIKAIMVFSTDRDGVNISSSLPSAVQWQLIECLEFLLAKRFDRPNLALAKVIHCLTELRTVRQQALDLLVSGFKFYKYSNVLGNPILKELLSDVLTLCGDPEEDFRENC